MITRLRLYWYSKKLDSIPKEYHYYLSKYNEYYNGLNEALQKEFRERLFLSRQFIDYKPLHFPMVTEEMIILITSALVQITFGLDKFILREFKSIYIIPFTYSYGKHKALVGHVNFKKKEIAFSWPSVKKGFIVPNDAINVALHEIAHALEGENSNRLLFNRFFDQLSFNEWELEGRKKLEKIRNKKNIYLRNYAGGNMLELFAVSIESFFEQSKEFKSKVPKLYAIMVQLFKQDPTNTDNPRIY